MNDPSIICITRNEIGLLCRRIAESIPATCGDLAWLRISQSIPTNGRFGQIDFIAKSHHTLSKEREESSRAIFSNENIANSANRRDFLFYCTLKSAELILACDPDLAAGASSSCSISCRQLPSVIARIYDRLFSHRLDIDLHTAYSKQKLHVRVNICPNWQI